jgi:hypothetical protein
MNNNRLTTHKNYKQVEISSDRINQVLSSPSVYEYKDGARYVSGGIKISSPPTAYIYAVGGEVRLL